MSALIGLLASAFVAGVAVPAGARLINQAITGSRPRVGSGGSNLKAGSVVDEVPKIGKIETDFRTLANRVARAEDLSAGREMVISELLAGALFVDDEASLKTKMEALNGAVTIEGLNNAARSLLAEIGAQHKRVFRSSIKIACTKASVNLGFSKLEMLSGPQDSVTRIAASDAAGRTLITEISTDGAGKAKIDTEVLGMNGNGCEKLLDDYHKELIAEGIRVDAPPKRERTGGTCALPSARAFLKMRQTKRETGIGPAPRPGASTGAGASRKKSVRKPRASVLATAKRTALRS